jgi:hypothetical protein
MRYVTTVCHALAPALSQCPAHAGQPRSRDATAERFATAAAAEKWGQRFVVADELEWMRRHIEIVLHCGRHAAIPDVMHARLHWVHRGARPRTPLVTTAWLAIAERGAGRTGGAEQ